MNSSVTDIAEIIRSFREGREELDQLRIDRIKNSDILVDGPILQDAFESAKFLGVEKPLSGLVELRRILSKIKR
jgi:hypothetical protein